ncbi:PREDICTED: ribonuclease P protein subunit p21 [Dinoponera quadriceps]|uniref:Ribonuclease P protein subunit p21 n=1 Tax=Dinoponera quadriceps TaxID=609295 RepID=A0A6P3XLY2_DINQU|nr:PREDICTED: ribonuclease P protein subunit p21 [Dinoponera quadriceps]XP_014479436.1 PREDICTED: ribonuclease P protein subunit p21 [Dinoponera quadriceps]XP_014479444.1 PREDICTED: ribonuclease P protein subunit p21 [Dinoponera quadriceps]XP_014479455.1 PREDICTED: ribonuclease P protein subunit p21 [Dinoponera quadriceps]
MMKNKTRFCQNKDIFERMNYLYQASHLIALKDKVAASYYGNMMMRCAKKVVLHVEPNLKRTLCKCCQTPLIPGETARVRLISKPVKGVKWTCLTCMNTKRFPTRKGYKLWLDEPQAVFKIFDYTPEEEKKEIEDEGKDKNERKRKKEDIQQSDLQGKSLNCSSKCKKPS